MFPTGNDLANRAVDRAAARDELDLVAITVHGPNKGVDKTVKGSRRHQ